MTIYTMSETGACPRVLSAVKLKYDAVPRTGNDEERLEYYTTLEAVAAKKLQDMGYELIEGSWCPTCQRHGIHVEVKEGLFTLVGHLDRRIVLADNRTFPVEIKCLGPDSWKLFRGSQFEHFRTYAAQEACYLHAEQKPGIYWVMNRDSGECLKYIVNDTDGVLDLEGFIRITLPVTYDAIVDKLNLVELDIAEGRLSDPEPDDFCWFCVYKFLCSDKKNVTGLVEDKEVVTAAELYKEGFEERETGQDKIDKATGTLVGQAKTSGIDKFKAAGVSFSYHGLKTRESIDAAKLKELVSGDIVKQVTKQSKPFESYTIKILER